MDIEIPEVEMSVVAQMQEEIANGYVKMQNLRAEGKPIVWRSLLIPREIFQAMDVATVCGDLLGGNIGVFGQSGKYCQIAEEAGLSRDVCAVHKSTLGLAFVDGKDDLFSLGFAPPDLVIGCNFPCMSYSKSSLNIARKYNAPYYFIDAPINTWKDEIPDHAIKYYVSQLQGVIDILQEYGYTFDMDRLKEEVAFTKILNTLLEEIDTYKRAVPAPMKPYDSAMAATMPLQISDKTRTLELFTKLRDELKHRVENGIGIVEIEKLRLMWIGNPPIVDFDLLSYPEKHGAVIAKSLLELLTGFTLDPDLIDPENPLDSIARAHLYSPANPTHHGMLKYFLQQIENYKIDGIISVVKRSCGHLPGSIRLSKDEIYEKTGVPTIVFNCEGSDSREYDADDARANIDTFVETLLTRKEG